MDGQLDRGTTTGQLWTPMASFSDTFAVIHYFNSFW